MRLALLPGMPAINAENAKGWQVIADMLSRQRPYPGRMATIVRGKNHKGSRVRILRHQIDRYEDVFRYGNDASHHMREMRGRNGFVCLVEVESGERIWVKAKYLACEFNYTHWSIALADAIDILR